MGILNRIEENLVHPISPQVRKMADAMRFDGLSRRIAKKVDQQSAAPVITKDRSWSQRGGAAIDE